MHRTIPPLVVLAVAAATACADRTTTSPVVAEPVTLAASGGGNPSFHKADYVIPGSGGHRYDLALTFKQTGLGSFSHVSYKLSGLVDIAYRCLNSQDGGPDLNAEPHHHLDAPTPGVLDLAVHNGQTTGTIYLDVDVSSVDCPQGGLHPSVVSITYTQISLAWGDVPSYGPVPPNATMSAPAFDVVVPGVE